MSPKTLVLGNSHTQALEAAALGDALIEIHWLKTKPDARFGSLILEDACNLITSLSSCDQVVVMHLGALHNIFGLLNAEQPFTFSNLEECKPDAEIIPRAAMRAHFREHLKRDQVLKMFADLSPCRVHHCMTPPPKKAPPVPRDDKKAYRGMSIRDIGFTSAEIRREMWRLECMEIQAYCQELGVSFLPPPVGTVTDDGFLKPEYYARDATHANEQYGAKILDQIQNLLQDTALMGNV